MSPIWPIDIVFANAGVAEMAPLEGVSEAHFDKIFDVNVSVASVKGTPAFAVYGASKAAIRNFVRGWTVELKDRRIRSNALSPGPITTPVSCNSVGFTLVGLRRPLALKNDRRATFVALLSYLWVWVNRELSVDWTGGQGEIAGWSSLKLGTRAGVGLVSSRGVVGRAA